MADFRPLVGGGRTLVEPVLSLAGALGHSALLETVVLVPAEAEAVVWLKNLAAIDPDRRAETLEIKEWKNLTKTATTHFKNNDVI